ncbi:MAG: DUF554 domain-containing protein [Lachnospiraceae bacterium]|nr:DUF554 domain-containing protein [Lachnospiraceae bacterium]
MIGLGTIINTAGVIAGGLIGLGLKNGIKKNMQDIMMQACGVATIFIGGAGALSKMLVFQDGKLETQGTMLLIFSLVLGSLLGEWINIEQKMDILGERIKKAVKAENDNLFVEGFVNVSLIICVGAMAIVGSVQDGISGDYSMLVAKAILDLIIVVVFAATYGIGAIFSAVPIFVYQGAITLAAAFLGSFVSEAMINDLSFIGSALIFCVGVNIGFGKKFRVGNMLPALIVPVLYEILRSFLRL